jgi:hypothetical protein
MAANIYPIFYLRPFLTVKSLTAALTDINNIASPAESTSFIKIYETPSGTDEGGGIDKIQYQFIATTGTPTTSACIIYLWVTDASGNNARAVESIIQAAGALISNTVSGPMNYLMLNNMNLQPGQHVYASVTVLAANTQLNISSYGGYY